MAFNGLNWAIEMKYRTMGKSACERFRAIGELKCPKMAFDQYLTCQIFSVRWVPFLVYIMSHHIEGTPVFEFSFAIFHDNLIQVMPIYSRPLENVVAQWEYHLHAMPPLDTFRLYLAMNQFDRF